MRVHSTEQSVGIIIGNDLKRRSDGMKTREEALEYGLSFPDTYTEMPFHDPNWQLVRVKGSKKAFLWAYEKDGCLHLNVKDF